MNRKRKNINPSEQDQKKRKLETNVKEEDREMHVEEEEEDVEDEEDLDFLEEMEDMEEDEPVNDSQDQPTPIARNFLFGARKDWKRASNKPINESEDKIVFMQIESDYNISYAKSFRFRYPGRQNGQVPVVRFYGVTKDGDSILARLWGFKPYFYALMPKNFNYHPQKLEEFRNYLNSHFQNININKINDTNYIERIESCEKTSVWQYQFGKKKRYLKIFTGIPAYVPRIRDVLERGMRIPGISGSYNIHTFESNVLFVLRCMIDIGVTGCGWVELPPDHYQITPQQHKESLCDIELDCSCEDIIGHDAIGDWQVIAPLRIVSFDIECLGYTDDGEEDAPKPKKKRKKKNANKMRRKKKKKKKNLVQMAQKKLHFPKAEIKECAVIQIANTVTVQGEMEPRIQNVFVLNTCSPIADCEVLSYKTEKDLLLAWADFIRQIDPDILTGYNVINFDFPYLLDRAKYLKIPRFKFLGRLAKKPSTMKKTRFSSNQMGTRETRDIKIQGRVILDVLDVVRRDYKLSSYTLNNVSSRFLEQQKEDVHYSIMKDLQEKDEESRKRLAIYCLKDALLPQRLIDKLMIVVNNIEMARVCGLPMSMILSRGQQIKVLTQLLREAGPRNIILPYVSQQRGGGADGKRFTGATVIEPKAGFYNKTPISTLDFASLYPSIMIAHNLCYSTMIPMNRIHEFQPEDYVETPTGNFFVKKTVFEGLLPLILRNLLDARQVAKDDLKKATDPIQKAVLNGRQLALKISANSVYGFTGAARGQLPCLAISSSVTGFGRNMLERTKEWVEREYSVANGFQWDSEVIYGDTDSVMIKFGTESLKHAIELGKEAGVEVSKIFEKPIRLEFEKAYHPYLLLSKKHYAGLLFTRYEKHDKIDTKGIETVRRDRCALIRNLYKTCLYLILIKRSVSKARLYVKMVIEALLKNELDVSMLIITKTLALKEYKAKQAHAELAERLRKRNPATAPKQGDRVMFVYVAKQKDAKAYEKGEDPLYVIQNDLAVDTTYYLEKKLKPSLKRLFDRILSQRQLNEMFSGDHTRKIVIPTPSSTGLMRYYKKKIHCVGCRKQVKGGEAICEVCKPNEATIYEKIMFRRNHLEQLYNRAWAYCQECQKSLSEVLCTNDDCPLFFMRCQVKNELAKCQKKMDRFATLEW